MPQQTLSRSTAQLRVDGVSRVFGDRRVLTDVSLVLGPDARVGLIGENGAGKSTLLRIIAGLDEPDAGSVAVPARTELLRQELPYPSEATVGRVLDDALAASARAVAAVEDASAAVARGERGADRLLADALEDAEATDAWSAGARRGEVVAGLGLDAIDDERTLGSLSGGQRSRVAMAALLLARPTALLLDEPTNHLDDDAVAFLERTLAAWPGPVLFASHDRAFLDAVATRVVDLDPAPRPFADVIAGDDAGGGYGLRSSRGGYTAHLAERRAERTRWERRFAEEQEELNALRQEVAVTARQTNRKDTPRTEARGAKKFYSDKDAKVTSRLVRNARVRLEALEREQVRKPPPELRFGGLLGPSGAPGGGPLALLTRAAVEGRLAPTTLAVDPGAKLLVTGRNGAGKSTLLLLLDGRLAPTAGTVQRAPRLRSALLAQDVVVEDPMQTARDAYRAALGERRAEAVPLSVLGLVAGRDVDRPVGALSVGQQRRLALAIAIADPPDLLLLDEPTNHLSLALAEELEEALDSSPGAVVLASHDRWLRRRWSGQVLSLG
ncbi:ABC-F family ATP-binding cassette domain-containing protein [Amnibacterium kyonggiense]|uniref:Macrolide transport system ATP-binding/permease protein n=1 Tax=Amnibacterium kyonggiense TaxID=595671 RepID=A0A4R7FRS9_9MICO|nr:ABC-F family ATP-binding cassette domain-containing protein [Amnibacterium kyonggiense]TDS80520.1 macrolide transport system ATP-binding/permease protein [Amnibacterium kyonggiense]